jgi:FAD/FMN-containing dehydrogenase
MAIDIQTAALSFSLSGPSGARRRTADPTLRDLRALDAAIAGSVVAPGDDAWDDARAAWNLTVDQRPAAVVLPQSADDVARIVDFARERRLRVAPQGTGHSAATLEDRLGGSLLLRTDRMRAVQIDPDSRRARVEAGALWIDVTTPAAEHGLAALAGSSPDVGVVGYTLGGGISWFSRRYGLAANHVTAIEVVTADGRRLRASGEEHAELFWALRGGGGSFAVVTAIEIELLPIREVYAGAMFWPQERAREVLQAWREWTLKELPDEIISVGRILNPPPIDEVPELVRGRRFVVVEAMYLGEEAEGAALLEPLRGLGPEIDTFATIPAVALSHLHMDPEHPVPGKGDGMLIDSVAAEMIDAFVQASTGEAGSALLSAELRQLGGAIARPAPEHGATGSIGAPYAMYTVGAVPVPELLPVVEKQVEGVTDALAPYDAGHGYLNFSERDVHARTLYRTEYAYRRLRAVKARYDAGDVIQSNHPIPAAR